MQQTKAELLDQKIEAQNKLMKSQLLITKNVDARIEAIKRLLVEKAIFTEEEYQTYVDAQLGLRKKTAEEEIASGDIVWVSYVASPVDDLANQMIEKGIPLRVGSGAVPFEHELIGKPVTTKGHTFDLEHDGKTFKFMIDVNLVKTKLGENSVVDSLEQ